MLCDTTDILKSHGITVILIFPDLLSKVHNYYNESINTDNFSCWIKIWVVMKSTLDENKPFGIKLVELIF